MRLKGSRSSSKAVHLPADLGVSHSSRHQCPLTPPPPKGNGQQSPPARICLDENPIILHPSRRSDPSAQSRSFCRRLHPLPLHLFSSLHHPTPPTPQTAGRLLLSLGHLIHPSASGRGALSSAETKSFLASLPSHGRFSSWQPGGLVWKD